MIGLVLVTHGRLAHEFVAAMQHVVGPQEQIRAISIAADDDIEQRRQDIVEAVEATDTGDGVIILTDMFGGTPSNLGITFLEQDKIEIVTGVNLPMLIKAAGIKDGASLIEIARVLREHGRNAIWVASDLLGGAPDTPSASAAAAKKK